ncbi:MAG: GNAT family N-acetyltransferase [Chloroflexi bacterium]|jgi:GNAT superfamily N-acetyltransferase|nr:GNAT family N-acetyltransferase [Chloroflexota bacterium]
MNIRNLRVEDFFLLNELDWSPLPKERDSIYLLMALEQQPCSFVAQDDEGTFLGVLLASRGANGDSIYLNHLLVHQNARGLGLGSRLMAALDDYAVQAGVAQIWLLCESETIDYYQSKGYAESYKYLTQELEQYLLTKKRVHRMVKIFK